MKPDTEQSISAKTVLADIKVLMAVSLILPVLILAIFGLVSIVRQGYSVHFAALLLVSTLITLAPRLWQKVKGCRQPAPGAPDEADESWVTPSGDWGNHDIEVWHRLNGTIKQQLETVSDWGCLQDHALEIANQTAQEYQRKELSFSIPELLKLTEEVSKRYRQVLLSHVPGIEKVPLSLFKFGYRHQEKFPLMVNMVSALSKLIRVARVSNPFAFITAEIKTRLIGEAFGTFSDRVQYKVKLALLQDVLSVAIDLYSGRFELDDEYLSISQGGKDDLHHLTAPLEPLRVCVIGQVSAGKSAIINTLTKKISAEVSALPSTSRMTVYQCQLEGIDMLHLIDLPGLDDNEATKHYLLEQATRANIILWVLKANQPGRAEDTQFKTCLDQFYDQPENRSRKMPVIVGVLNQVDRLKPVNEWQPPYNMNSDNPEMADSTKAKTIREALEYNRGLLGFTTLIPLSVSDSRESFNLPELEQTINDFVAEGLQVQLNCRRHETSGNAGLSEHMKRLINSGKMMLFSCSPE